MAKRRSAPKRRRRTSRYKRFRRRLPKTISILGAATFGVAELRAIEPSIPMIQSGDVMGSLKSLAHEHLATYTGFESGLFGGSGTWRLERAVATWLPIVIGGLASKYLGKYVNPTIKRLPFIGKKLRL